MDEQNKCFIDFYRFIDTIDINQIRFTLLIHMLILIFIDLLLRANWQQNTTLHVFAVVLHDHNVNLSRQPFYGKTMSYVPSQFQACPFLPGICRAFVILFWKSSKCPTVGPGVQYTKSLYYLSNISPFRLNHSLIPAQRECLFIQTLQTIH